MKLTIEQIAEAAYEAKRAYCQSIGDYSNPAWRYLATELKIPTINGVEYHLSHTTVDPKDLHNNWFKHLTSNGWVYGKEKNVTLKTHPCLVPYEALSKEHRAKDVIIGAVVSTLKKF